MATTQTRICNRALRKMGANKLLTDIDNTGDKNAIVLKDLYDETLQILLEEDFWTFATKRVVLDYATGQSNTWTKYQLNYIYDIPTDFIRIIGWSDESAIVRHEGAYLLSDSAGTISTVSTNVASTDEWVTATAYVEGDFVKEDNVAPWVTSTGYVIGNTVRNDGSVYTCTSDHTSGATTEPGTGASWATVWDLTSTSDYIVYYSKSDHTSASTDQPGSGTNWETYWVAGQEYTSGIWNVTITTRLGILYCYFDEDVTTWPPHFFETFATLLAKDACYTITQNRVKEQDLIVEYKDARAKAKSKNGQGQTPQTPKADAWVNAKFRGGAIVNGARRIYFRS